MLPLVKYLETNSAVLSPRDNVDEVRLPLAAVTTAEITVDRKRKRRDGDLGLGITKLGVTGQTAHEHDVIEHCRSSLFRATW